LRQGFVNVKLIVGSHWLFKVLADCYLLRFDITYKMTTDTVRKR